MDSSEMGRIGGKRRAANMTAKQRSEQARRAVQERWRRHRIAAAKAAAARAKRRKAA